MPGTLYVVATPIGNLEDVTLRALRILREVSVIAAEDTRRTARLLQHYSISTPTTSLHEHNERSKAPSLVRRLKEGESVALVSDAGTPVVSDPGAHLVSAAHAAGVRVEPVPGPSAALAALSASGFSAGEVLFLGFPPNRANSRRAWLARLVTERRVLVMYEAPHRIRETIRDILDVLGDRELALARELTKAHEELVVQPISHHLATLREGRGEYTLVIRPTDGLAESVAPLPSDEEVAQQFGGLTNTNGLGRRQAIRTLAERYGRSSREIYALLERCKASAD
jgi:16S rRNA (cytidine1402-2'-O)-methyltransferase